MRSLSLWPMKTLSPRIQLPPIRDVCRHYCFEKATVIWIAEMKQFMSNDKIPEINVLIG